MTCTDYQSRLIPDLKSARQTSTYVQLQKTLVKTAVVFVHYEYVNRVDIIIDFIGLNYFDVYRNSLSLVQQLVS